MRTADSSSSERLAVRASRRALLRAAGGGTLALAGAGLTTRMVGAQGAVAIGTPAASPAPTAQSVVAAFPAPGTVTASPGTEITFRGVVGETLGTVEVYGSVSGLHSGFLETHRDGAGASFLVDAAFQPGETVTVTADIPVGPGANGALEFTVSRPAPSDVPRVTNPEEPVGAELETFRTHPEIQVPNIEVQVLSDDIAPGYAILSTRVENGPSAAMIVDNNGDAVWARPAKVPDYQMLDLRVQEYQGRPVLSWFEGASPLGIGYGHFEMIDAAYRPIATVQVGNDFYGADIHEFLITPQDTAILLIYQPIFWDLTPVGGSADGAAHDSILQEIDIETGRVYFEWHSLDHVAVEETHRQPAEGVTLDYFHVNSGERDADGNYLVSARHTDAIYKVDGRTGAVIWRLNGSQSDFEMGEGTPFRLQHDARVHPDGSISLFDNATEQADSGILSRGLVLDLDEEAMTATLVREYLHPDEVVSVSQANMQMLPNGNVFIGWGSAPVYSEHAEDGTLLLDARMPSGVNSYRAYRSEWVGRPVAPPQSLTEHADDGTVTMYVSWNGATEVAGWEIHAGDDAASLASVGTFQRGGFETTITGLAPAGVYVARALDANGALLGVSEPIEVS